MMHIGPPLASMDLYLRREKGTISGVIHDKRAGKGGCISGLDQLLLYLDAVISEDPAGWMPAQEKAAARNCRRCRSHLPEYRQRT